MLFLRELKKCVCSVTFVILTAFIVIMAYSQDVFKASTDDVIAKPEPGQDNYGIKNAEVPQVIMPAAVTSLYGEFVSNRYTTYPVGFIKVVRLSDDEQRQMAQLLSEITGIPADDLYEDYASGAGTTGSNGTAMVIGESGAGGQLSYDGDGNLVIVNPEAESTDGASAAADELDPSGNPPTGADGAADMPADGNAGQREITVKSGLTYESFKSIMDSAAGIIGRGSSYDSDSLISFGKVPMTYEDAMKDYGAARDQDHFTGSYARLFSDYMVVILCALPVFLAVALSLKDSRGGVAALLYTRRVSSIKLILVRYCALLVAVFVPVLIVSYIYNASAWGFYPGETLDYLAPLKYTLGYIMPSVMMAVAVGMLLTELTGTPIAVLVMGLWWFVDVNTGIRISGEYPLWLLAPRHNNLHRADQFVQNLPSLLANRLLFAGGALVLVGLTVIVFELKRKGKLGQHGGLKRLIHEKKSVAAHNL